MAVPYVDEVSARCVALNLNSNARINRFIIFENLVNLGVVFGPNDTFESDTIRFLHNTRHFRLDFEDIYQYASLTVSL